MQGLFFNSIYVLLFMQIAIIKRIIMINIFVILTDTYFIKLITLSINILRFTDRKSSLSVC